MQSIINMYRKREREREPFIEGLFTFQIDGSLITHLHMLVTKKGGNKVKREPPQTILHFSLRFCLDLQL